MLEDEREKLLRIKKLYFLNANIFQNRKQLLLESNIRNFLERDEKKLLYRHIHNHGCDKIDDQLMEIGVITDQTGVSTIKKLLGSQIRKSMIINPDDNSSFFNNSQSKPLTIVNS
jgi:hypothetical protein